MLRYINEIFADSKKRSPVSVSSLSPSPTKKLSWKLSPQALQNIQSAASRFDQHASSLEFASSVYSKYGSHYLKNKKISADGKKKKNYFFNFFYDFFYDFFFTIFFLQFFFLQFFF